MNQVNYDLVVIGAGPAGEVGAIRGAQLGLKTALIERSEHLGGTCLNVGCIPTKSLLESAKTWIKLKKAQSQGFSFDNLSFDWQKILQKKEDIVCAQRKGLKFLMKKHKIDVFEGTATFLTKHTLNIHSLKAPLQSIETKHVLIATGSKVRDMDLSSMPPIDGVSIHSSDTILSISQVPQSLAVIGGGVVGLEFASLFNGLGCHTEVFEASPQVLTMEDTETVKELVRCMKKQNIAIHVATKIAALKVHPSARGCTLTLSDGTEHTCEVVLYAIGRQPVTKDLNLAGVGMVPDPRGYIPVDAHYKTSVSHIFAVGDVISTPALAHTASAEALHAVEVIAGHTPPVIDYYANPSAIYTFPEIASIGLTEEALQSKGTAYKVAKFPFAPMAKAKIEDATEGFIKILFEPTFRDILGVHIVGSKATELIGEFVLGKILETTLDEIGHAIHPHPTLSETIMEAAHAGLGGAIHM